MTDVERLRRHIQSGIQENDPRLDSVLYNGGTVVAFAATVIVSASFWPPEYNWIGQVLSAIAAFLIAIERALNFGARWIFHRKIRLKYEALMARLDIAESLDTAMRTAKIEGIVADLELIKAVEGEIPPGPGLSKSG